MERETATELITRCDQGMLIYQHYLPRYTSKPIRPNLQCKSPLREEKHDSFNLFKSPKDNNIWWKDQADIGGDAVKLVMLLENVEFKEALKIIRRDILHEDEGSDPITRLGEKYFPRPKQPVEHVIYPKILTPRFRAAPFYADGFAAFDNRYYPYHVFGPQILAAYRCQPLDSYHYHNTDPDSDPAHPGQGKQFTVQADHARNPLYHYGFGTDAQPRHKIVRPFHWQLKKGKWVGTTKTEQDIFGLHLVALVNGRRLPAGIIAAGNRDTMATAKLTGLPVVATSAEGHLFTPEQVMLLHGLVERWYVLYDLDETGQKFQAILTDDYASAHHKKWVQSHPEREGYRFGFHGGLDVLLKHYQQNDVTKLLLSRHPSEHPRIGTWIRQAVGLF